MSRDKPLVPGQSHLPSSSTEVAAFLTALKAAPPAGAGRLVFALDATASRQPTWDQAMRVQDEMFRAATGLAVQLVYYRGLAECRASPWLRDGAEVQRRMRGVACLAGRTQIGRVLRHALAETRTARVAALVFVGDAIEEELDDLGASAGELGLLGVRGFFFHEGRDPAARNGFEQLAKLTGGACCAFDAGSGDELRRLLGAVAAYAAGGREALLAYAGAAPRGAVALLTSQVRG